MIDHFKLIDLLSERLRIEIKTAGADLLELLEQLHITLKDHGTAELTGLGTFYLKGNNVSFDPDPQLVMDINFRYHGMHPIVLEVANSKTEAPDTEEHDVPETAVFVFNEPVTLQFSTGPASPTETDGLSANDDMILDGFNQISNDALHHVDDLVTLPESEPTLVNPQAIIKPTSRALKTPPLSRPNSHTIPIIIKIDGDYVHGGDHWRRILSAAVFALILLVGISFSWYSGWLAGTGMPEFHEVFPEYATRNDPGSITIESPTIDEQEQEQEQEQAAMVGSFGLLGAWQQDLTDYFTIVSATMFTERVANEVFAEVVASDTRARLLRVRIQGDFAWELHLGQFVTRKEAIEVNRTLDRKFQSEVVRQYGQQ